MDPVPPPPSSQAERGRRATAALAAIILAACGLGRDDGSVPAAPPDRIRLERVGSSSQVPYSLVPGLARLGIDGVCIFDSYHVELLCGDREWRGVVTVAREGSGPGEIGGFGRLVSAPDGGIAFVDMGNRRISFFSSDRVFVGSARFPAMSPSGDVTEDSMIAAFDQPFPSREPAQQLHRVAAFSGTVTNTTVLRFDPGLVGRESAMITDGVLAPDGRILARITAGDVTHLAWYSPDGGFLGLLDFPSFGPVYPTHRDMEVHAEGYRMLFQRDLPDEEIRRYAETPLGRFRRGSAYRVLQVDEVGRAWVPATRPSDRGTFFELFAGTDHVGSLEVPGRIVAFQLSDSLLIALVEDMNPGEDGLYPRRVDWYRIIEEPTDG